MEVDCKPADVYLRNNYENIRAMIEIRSKLKIKNTRTTPDVMLVSSLLNFEHISHSDVMFPLHERIA